jgi:hypothetical protein
VVPSESEAHSKGREPRAENEKCTHEENCRIFAIGTRVAAEVIYDILEARLEWRAILHITEGVKVRLPTDACTPVLIFEGCQVPDDLRIVDCWAIRVYCSPRLTQLEISRFLIACKHVLCCTIKHLSVVLLDQVVAHDSIIYDFLIGHFLGIPVWPNPQLLKHDLSARALGRAQISLFHLCVCVIKCDRKPPVLQTGPPLKIIAAIVLDQGCSYISSIDQVEGGPHEDCETQE